MDQPIDYTEHDLNRAFTALHAKKPYEIKSLGGAIITLKDKVFVPDSLVFGLANFGSQFLAEHHEVRAVADLGTGSGVLAVSLAKLYPHKKFSAFDISPAAIGLAKENARINQLHNLKVVMSRPHEWVPSAYREPVDLIISNPPFIGRDEWNDPQLFKNFPDGKYQPKQAMKTGDRYGFSAYIAIVETALHRKVRWVIFRANGAYSDMLIEKLRPYAAKLTTHMSNACPIIVLELPAA
ncbi:MAG TPA: methyltransferase [Candidatus Saccharimonadales bacterium]|nr:methyltransferase [Candidatus Saccharimonadales bacterium]